MKFYTGQKVILLDTEFKPAGSAIICNYQESTNKYEVDFTYPGNDKSDKLSIPAERLLVYSEF